MAPRRDGGNLRPSLPRTRERHGSQTLESYQRPAHVSSTLTHLKHVGWNVGLQQERSQALADAGGMLARLVQHRVPSQ